MKSRAIGEMEERKDCKVGLNTVEGIEHIITGSSFIWWHLFMVGKGFRSNTRHSAPW